LNLRKIDFLVKDRKFRIKDRNFVETLHILVKIEILWKDRNLDTRSKFCVED